MSSSTALKLDPAARDFQSLVDQCSMAIIVQKEEVVVYVNRAALDCLGFGSADELVGKPVIELLEEKSYPTLATNFRKAGPSDDQFFLGDLKLRRCSGALIDAEVYHSGIDFQGGEATMINFRDVTATKRMENELRQAQKLEAVGRLAAGIAHEINTPIQYIGDSAQYILNALKDVLGLVAKSRALVEQSGDAGLVGELAAAEEAADLDYARSQAPRSVERIIDGVARVARIVHAMKTFSHPGADTPTPMDVVKMLEDTLVIAGHELRDTATVSTDFEKLPAVHCYPGDLNQAFLNLIVNAAHAIVDRQKKEGHDDPGTVTVSAKADGAHVEIRVADNGCGMTPDVQARLFEPFFTTKEVGRGTGQGLSVVRAAIIDKHNGSVRFESHVGVGTTCIVRLPLVAPAPGAL
jgi:PAS domain S-box-containing protein